MQKGKLLEKMLDFTHQLYRNHGKADINKKEIKAVFDKRSKSMRYVKKEGFDFEGCVAPDGRSIAIEAKESSKSLYVDQKNRNGIRIHQLESLFLRHKMGGMAAIIWMSSPTEVFLLDSVFLKHFYEKVYDSEKGRNGRLIKSISLETVKRYGCKQVMSGGMIDYLEFL